MNVGLYQKAKRYATKIKYTDPIDLVHDSYLNWYEKTGQDLFNEPEGRVMKVVNLTFRDYLNRRTWMYNGVKYSKNYFNFLDGGLELETAHKYDPITPEDHLIAQDLKDRFFEVVEGTIPIVKEILEYKYKGYKNNEIAEELGVAKSLITYYLKQVDLNVIRQ